MTIKEIYEKLNSVGVLTASTICGDEVHSRIMHLNGYDDQGIYIRTMWNKPYGRQLMETGKVTLCGASDTRILGHNEDGVPDFPGGYGIRLVGEVKFLDETEIRKRAENNEGLKTAVYDMDHYPAMKKGNFIIHRGKVDIFDHDFECKSRDHKVLRIRDSFGGMEYNKVGPTITDKCIECGLCLENCTFKAIEAGTPYRVIPERCDDCGTCIENCPADAIELSKPL